MNDLERINELKKLKYISFNKVKTYDLYLKDENNKTFFEYIVMNNILRIKNYYDIFLIIMNY